MAKSNRLITLDVDINEKLKEVDNASALVNDLLHGHFNEAQSNNVTFLTKKVEEYDLSIKQMSFTRDSLANKIRILNEKSKDLQETEKAKEEIAKTDRNYDKWMSDQCKQKIINFEQYRMIKEIHNWYDCVDAIMDGKLTMEKLIETATQQYLKSSSSNQ